MLTRYLDRREYIRVPASGPVWWWSGERCGVSSLHDLSPGGAGLRMTAARAGRVGDRICLAVHLTDNTLWYLARNACVVRSEIDHDGIGRVGVRFPGPDESCPEAHPRRAMGGRGFRDPAARHAAASAAAPTPKPAGPASR